MWRQLLSDDEDEPEEVQEDLREGCLPVISRGGPCRTGFLGEGGDP